MAEKRCCLLLSVMDQPLRVNAETREMAVLPAQSLVSTASATEPLPSSNEVRASVPVEEVYVNSIDV